MKIITYIDGFNFYHSISNLLATQNKPSKFKWVDFTKMAALNLCKNSHSKKEQIGFKLAKNPCF